MSAAAWPHQARGSALAASRPATMLAWEMGTGKTRAALDAIRAAGPARVLVVAPLAVCPVWPAQIAVHAPDLAAGYEVRDLSAVRGTAAGKADALRALGPRHVAILNYDIAWRKPVLDVLLAHPPDMIVLDEAHRIKSPSGAASRALRRVAWKTPRRLALTGTPMPHSPLDLWAQFCAIDPGMRVSGLPRTVAEFKGRYAIMGGYRDPMTGRGMEIVGWRDLDDLERRFLSIADRVRADDVLALPETTHAHVVVDIPPAARRAYRDMETDLVAELDAGTVTAANGAVKLMRLQQIASGSATDEIGVRRPVHDAKARALASMLEDIDPREPVAVFCRFTASLDAILRVAEAAGRPADEVSGRRKTIAAKWAPAPGAVAAVQAQAGGLGIDLSAAHYGAWMEHPLSLGDYDQCLARLRRPGQAARTIHWTHILAGDTVDARIMRALESKRGVVEAVLDGIANRRKDIAEWIDRIM